jgi:anti-anti-sigma regulatory factor
MNVLGALFDAAIASRSHSVVLDLADLEATDAAGLAVTGGATP